MLVSSGRGKDGGKCWRRIDLVLQDYQLAPVTVIMEDWGARMEGCRRRGLVLDERDKGRGLGRVSEDFHAGREIYRSEFP